MTISYHPHERKRSRRIGAGPFMEILEGKETIPISQDLLSRNNVYVLQVRGDSMEREHLFNGDHVIMERRDTARDGEMVLALTSKGEVTLRRFFRDGSQIRLETADPSAEALLVEEEDVTIQGVVVGILRKYYG